MRHLLFRKRLLHHLAFFLVFGGFALGQCGCTTGLSEWVHNGFKVGPNFHEPPVPITQQWIEADNPRVRHGDPNICSWWDVFDDPILTALLHQSYSHNLTVRAAGFQILAAKNARAIALGELLPQAQSFSLLYTRNEVSATKGIAAGANNFFGTGLAPGAALTPVAVPSTPIAGVVDPGNGATTNASSSTAVNGGTNTGSNVGFNRFFSNVATSMNLSWELDFWGLFRRNLEASDASLDQSVENYDELLVLLLANVATEYVEIRTLQKRLELAKKNVAQQEPLVAIYKQRYDAGIANSYPGYYQLKSNLENTIALIPQLEISLRQANNQLCALLGIPVRDLLPELGDGTVPDKDNPSQRVVSIPRPKDESVVVGIPADLLLRRPDVLAAEDQLKYQSAQIGIAEAEMYPHMGINGSVGLAADKLGLLLNDHSWTGTIGPSLSWNILNYGRLLANVRVQNDQYLQFVSTYQQAILNANQDAENALIAYLKTLDQAAHLISSADAASKLTGYLLKQFKEGYLPPGAADTSAFINQLFTALNFQVTQQDVAAQAEGNIALNLILIYRAMGGGWQIRLEDGAKNCATAAVGDYDLALPTPQSVPEGPAPEVLPPPSLLK